MAPFDYFFNLPADVLHEILVDWISWKDLIRFDSANVNKKLRQTYFDLFLSRNIISNRINVPIDSHQDIIFVLNRNVIAEWFEKRHLASLKIKLCQWMVSFPATNLDSSWQLLLRNVQDLVLGEYIDFEQMLKILPNCTQLRYLTVLHSVFHESNLVEYDIDQAIEVMLSSSRILSVLANLTSFNCQHSEKIATWTLAEKFMQQLSKVEYVEFVFEYPSFISLESMFDMLVVRSANRQYKQQHGQQAAASSSSSIAIGQQLKRLHLGHTVIALTKKSSSLTVGEQMDYLFSRFSSSLSSSSVPLFSQLCSITANFSTVYVIAALAPFLQSIDTYIEIEDSEQGIQSLQASLQQHLGQRMDIQQQTVEEEIVVYDNEFFIAYHEKMMKQQQQQRIVGRGGDKEELIFFTTIEWLMMLTSIQQQCPCIKELIIQLRSITPSHLFFDSPDAAFCVYVYPFQYILKLFLPCLSRYAFNYSFYPGIINKLPLRLSSWDWWLTQQDQSCLLDLTINIEKLLLDESFFTCLLQTSPGLQSLSLKLVNLADEFLS